MTAPITKEPVHSKEFSYQTVFSNSEASEAPLQLPFGQQAGHVIYLLETATETEPVESHNNSLKLISKRALNLAGVLEVVPFSHNVYLGLKFRKIIYPFHFFF